MYMCSWLLAFGLAAGRRPLGRAVAPAIRAIGAAVGPPPPLSEWIRGNRPPALGPAKVKASKQTNQCQE
jgi:hypothetical protein